MAAHERRAERTEAQLAEALRANQDLEQQLQVLSCSFPIAEVQQQEQTAK